MRRRSLFAGAAVTAAALLFGMWGMPREAAAQTKEVRVLVSNGVKAVMDELRPDAERAIGHPLALQYDTTAALKQRIEGGEAFDVAFFTADAVDDLAKEGKLIAASRTAAGRVGVGVGIHAGLPKPDIKTADGLKKALLAAKSITYTEQGASRPTIDKMLDKMGIAAAVKPKTLLQAGAAQTTASVADGREEIILTLVSEILPVRGVELVGPLPAEFQEHVNFAAAVSAKSKNPDAGRALIGYISAPARESVYKSKGMELR